MNLFEYKRSHSQILFWVMLFSSLTMLYFGGLPRDICVVGAILILILGFSMGVYIIGDVEEIQDEIVVRYSVFIKRWKFLERVIPVESIDFVAIGKGRIGGAYFKLKETKNKGYDLILRYPMFDSLDDLLLDISERKGFTIKSEGSVFALGPNKANKFIGGKNGHIS